MYFKNIYVKIFLSRLNISESINLWVLLWFKVKSKISCEKQIHKISSFAFPSFDIYLRRNNQTIDKFCELVFKYPVRGSFSSI